MLDCRRANDSTNTGAEEQRSSDPDAQKDPDEQAGPTLPQP